MILERGFTLVEAVVSISLFSLMILGATLQLRAFEDGQRSISDALILTKAARTFLSELSQVARQTDKFNELVSDSGGLVRPSASVLDDFYPSVASGPLESTSGWGYNFLSPDDRDLNAALVKFKSRWTTADASDPANRTRLEKRIGRRASQWRIEVINPSSGAYRIIELHLDDDNVTNLQWPICCGD